MSCELKVSGWGQFNNFKHTLIIDKCIAPYRMVSFGVYTLGLEPVPLLEASLELLFHNAFQHHLWLCFNLCSVLEFSSLELYRMACFDLRKKVFFNADSSGNFPGV
jgi:hypothetical protein